MIRRPKILPTTADEALFLSDKCCCVCHDRAVGVQVHHLDGDPSNDEMDNLAVLCAHHHDEATREGGLTRKLSSGLIRLYREDWHAVVRARRERERPGPTADSLPTGRSKAPRAQSASRHPKRRGRVEAPVLDHGTAAPLLEVLAIHEIRKIGYELKRAPTDWARALKLIEPLEFYAERYRAPVGGEILSALSNLTARAKKGMDSFTASRVSTIAQAALPIASLVSPDWRARTPLELRVLSLGAYFGFELAYSGIKRLPATPPDLGVVDAGGEILWTVLRHATVNRNRDLAHQATDWFDQLDRVAVERGFPEARLWLAHQRADALDVAQEGPRPPDDLEEKIWCAREAAQLRISAALNRGSG